MTNPQNLPPFPSDLKIPGISVPIDKIEIVDPKNITAIDVECSLPCGEAGCVNMPDGMRCMCAEGRHLYEPEGTRCIRDIINPIDPTGSPNLPGNIPLFGGNLPYPDTKPHNHSSSLALVTKEISTDPVSDNPHLETVKIVVPVVGAALIVLLIILTLVVRRRRLVHTRNPKAESPISWLHKQEGVMLLDDMTVISKNPAYYTQDETFLSNVREKLIAKDRVQLLEEIGEGAFGKVFRGEVKYAEDDVRHVAVKILKEDATRETKDDFRREVEIMSSFEHENILKLIGVVAINEGDSPYMVFEYMEHGDLTELLRQNDPQADPRIAKKITLKQTDLVDIASQIANGMVYLTSRHFVHRDLATRNCLVGTGLQVKISDFGMSRDIYTCDYYRIGGARMLPVRWMSPQSMKYGRFTTESDVWSYGVVLWEIFTYGKQPYYGHSNEEVIRLLEDGILLQRPAACPDTIYHVMLGCWRREPKDRFTFERIHHHLIEFSRKMVKCYHEHNIETGVDLHQVEEV